MDITGDNELDGKKEYVISSDLFWFFVLLTCLSVSFPLFPDPLALQLYILYSLTSTFCQLALLIKFVPETILTISMLNCICYVQSPIWFILSCIYYVWGNQNLNKLHKFSKGQSTRCWSQISDLETLPFNPTLHTLGNDFCLFALRSPSICSVGQLLDVIPKSLKEVKTKKKKTR